MMKIQVFAKLSYKKSSLMIHLVDAGTELPK